jgi:hypothetical protein
MDGRDVGVEFRFEFGVNQGFPVSGAEYEVEQDVG